MTRRIIIVSWRGDGRELYYFSADQSVMAVEVTSSPVFQPGITKRLFKAAGAGGIDVTADGKKFLIVVPTADSASPPFTALLNWQAGLKK
jgi:hypothetical protein